MDNLVKSSTMIVDAVKILNEVKDYNGLQLKLLDVAEFLLKEYESKNEPTDEIKDLMDEIKSIGDSKDAE